MGLIRTSRSLFFTTSPRNPRKLIPEIKLLIDNFTGQEWTENTQNSFASILATAETFEGETSKKYSAFSARDRITRAPKSLGFVDLSPTILLTDAGNAFVNGPRPHEVFLRQLLKYQLPSPFHKEAKRIKGTFWGHPFLEIMRLIRDVDYLTPDEFQIFALQLTDYRKYDSIKEKIINFRAEKQKHHGRYKLFVDQVAKEEIGALYSQEIQSGNIATRESKTTDVDAFIKKQRHNMRDYADACFRYFRFTEMFVSNGKSIQIAPDKLPEIDYILESVVREPIFINDSSQYKSYLFDASLPVLYSDNRDNIEEILMHNYSFSKRDLVSLTVEELKDLRDRTTQERRSSIIRAQETELKSYALYQEVVDTFNEIISDDIYDAPLFFEWNTWRAMTMLDGGSIKGNFKIDDTGKPMSTAQGNMSDIECDYGDFALSVEVTLQRGHRQYETEGEPITRHWNQLRIKSGKETFCLFIAPVINKSTWEFIFGSNQIKMTAYGGTTKIIPLELDLFMMLIEHSYCHQGNPNPSDVYVFLKSSLAAIENAADENEWRTLIEQNVKAWLAA